MTSEFGRQREERDMAGRRGTPWPRLAAVAALALGAALLPAGGAAAAGPGPEDTQPAAEAHYTPAGCNTAVKGTQQGLVASCFSLVRTAPDHQVRADAAEPPAGALGPADVQDAYGLPDAGESELVAIVDAFGNSHAEEDLAAFREHYGLSPCTTENGCFTKVDQRGGTDYPSDNEGWALETSLDLDAVSAACPACHLLLVQADSPNVADLGYAVATAVELGAKYVSNSYGVVGEAADETDFDHFYNHQGVAVVASSGDDGGVTNWPATNPNVVAVGGTTLTEDDSERGWHETAWGSPSGGDGAGSGCSPYEPKPVYQNGIDTGCDNRAIADVSAVADPATGLAVYDTLGYDGWLQVGGTSLSAPLVAAMYALAGAPEPGTDPVTYPYDNVADPSVVHDVTEGANSGCGTVLCEAGPGWDGPTGLGTPAGVGALRYKEHGDIAGTVTDASTGEPVTGVQVSAGNRSAQTDGQGRYDINLPIGTYDVTATKYAYQPKSASVTVTADQTVAQDFALTPVPRQTVSGTVTDGSGHGWPLYAKVTSDDGAGHRLTAFTDPETGTYNLELPQRADYTLHVTAVYPGYQDADAQVSVQASDVTRDVALSIDSLACVAPGYETAYSGTTQAFDREKTPRHWRVRNARQHLPGYQNRPGWEFDNPGDRENNTGGDGNFAIVDSDHSGAHHVQDTVLTTPVLDLSDDATPALQFASDYQPAVNSTVSVEVRVEGGDTWHTVWQRHGFAGEGGPSTQVVPLPDAAHQSQVQVRFHYVGSWSQWWQIDDVFLGNRTCTPADGGLLVGRVSDTDGAGVTGATVSSVARPDEHATTVATPDDPNLGDGAYWLFTSGTGSQEFTAAKDGYQQQTKTVPMTAGQVTPADFTLTP